MSVDSYVSREGEGGGNASSHVLTRLRKQAKNHWLTVLALLGGAAVAAPKMATLPEDVDTFVHHLQYGNAADVDTSQTIQITSVPETAFDSVLEPYKNRLARLGCKVHCSQYLNATTIFLQAGDTADDVTAPLWQAVPVIREMMDAFHVAFPDESPFLQIKLPNFATEETCDLRVLDTEGIRGIRLDVSGSTTDFHFPDKLISLDVAGCQQVGNLPLRLYKDKLIIDGSGISREEVENWVKWREQSEDSNRPITLRLSPEQVSKDIPSSIKLFIVEKPELASIQ